MAALSEPVSMPATDLKKKKRKKNEIERKADTRM